MVPTSLKTGIYSSNVSVNGIKLYDCVYVIMHLFFRVTFDVVLLAFWTYDLSTIQREHDVF
jgi:hypothetical protein